MLYVGPLLGQVVNNMKDKRDGKLSAQQKAFIYSAVSKQLVFHGSSLCLTTRDNKWMYMQHWYYVLCLYIVVIVCILSYNVLRNDFSIPFSETTATHPNLLSINQSKRIHIVPCRKRIRGVCWAGLGRVFTFAVRSVKQFSFQSMPETTERLSWLTVVQQWVPDRWGTNTKGFRR